MEPRFEQEGFELFKELEDVSEILFLEKGFIDVGFEINRRPHMVLRIRSGTIIGGYNCSFNRKNMFLYRCYSNIEGYMLRKESWYEMMEEYEEVAGILKENMKKEFFTKIKSKAMTEKRKFIKRLK